MDILEYFKEEYEKINSSAENMEHAYQHAKDLYPKLVELCEMISSVPVTIKYEEGYNHKFDAFVNSLQAVTHDIQSFLDNLAEFNDAFNKAYVSVSKIKDHWC